MKTIGLIGGMSWESTSVYYRLINERVNAQLGSHHSAKLVLLSVDFDVIEQRQHKGDWAGTADILVDAARRIEAAGADLLLIGTNTMHKVADDVAAAVSIPLLHLADATADRIFSDGRKRVGLLGTRFTMEQPFYRERLEARGIKVAVPDDADRDTVHRIIYDELCHGRIDAASREQYLAIIDRLAADGAEAVILGCTEIGLLVKAQDTSVPLYDTTVIHSEAAVDLALRPESAQ